MQGPRGTYHEPVPRNSAAGLTAWRYRLRVEGIVDIDDMQPHVDSYHKREQQAAVTIQLAEQMKENVVASKKLAKQLKKEFFLTQEGQQMLEKEIRHLKKDLKRLQKEPIHERRENKHE